jgi:TldD protein
MNKADNSYPIKRQRTRCLTVAQRVQIVAEPPFLVRFVSHRLQFGSPLPGRRQLLQRAMNRARNARHGNGGTLMTAPTQTDRLFFGATGLDPERAVKHVDNALSGCDDGELFLEYRQSERLGWDDGQLKSASFEISQGFGLRAVAGESSGYCHSSELTEDALKRACETVSAARHGYAGTLALPPRGTNRHLYTSANPLEGVAFAEKVRLLQDIDAYARAASPKVRQVSAALSGEWQAVRIARADGTMAEDIRPLVQLMVSIVCADGDRLETGVFGAGGRSEYGSFISESAWKEAVDKALREAEIKLQAVDAPAGEMTVVLGSGWPGILLHEAIGHGLEGDFNRKKTSAFSGLMGKRCPGCDDCRRRDVAGSTRLPDDRRRGNTQWPYGLDRGRHFSRLHARPNECPTHGHGGHRKRPSGELSA